MATKLQNKLAYEAKQKELQGLVEKEAKNLQDVLDETITAKKGLVEQVERKARLNREVDVLNEKIKEQTDGLQEISDRVIDRLNKAKDELRDGRLKLEELRKEIQKEAKSLDTTKTYLNNLYGKVATYTKSAQTTLEYVNEHLEKTGMPINFGLLPDEVVNITLDNFTEKLNV